MAMEVLQNGNFESGLTGWTNREGTTLTLVNSPVAGGKQALKVSDRRNTGSGVTQDITGKVKAGKEYTISGKIQYRYDEADAPSSAYPDTKQFLCPSYMETEPSKILPAQMSPRGSGGICQELIRYQRMRI